jgi:hypothetical protein
MEAAPTPAIVFGGLELQVVDELFTGIAPQMGAVS